MTTWTKIANASPLFDPIIGPYPGIFKSNGSIALIGDSFSADIYSVDSLGNVAFVSTFPSTASISFLFTDGTSFYSVDNLYRLRKSVDGVSWSIVSTLPTSSFVGFGFIGGILYLFDKTNSHYYISNDSGATWSAANSCSLPLSNSMRTGVFQLGNTFIIDAENNSNDHAFEYGTSAAVFSSGGVSHGLIYGYGAGTLQACVVGTPLAARTFGYLDSSLNFTPDSVITGASDYAIGSLYKIGSTSFFYDPIAGVFSASPTPPAGSTTKPTIQGGGACGMGGAIERDFGGNLFCTATIGFPMNDPNRRISPPGFTVDGFGLPSIIQDL